MLQTICSWPACVCCFLEAFTVNHSTVLSLVHTIQWCIAAAWYVTARLYLVEYSMSHGHHEHAHVYNTMWCYLSALFTTRCICLTCIHKQKLPLYLHELNTDNTLSLEVTEQKNNCTSYTRCASMAAQQQKLQEPLQWMDKMMIFSVFSFSPAYSVVCIDVDCAVLKIYVAANNC